VLTRKAAEGLREPLWHYIDFPYFIQKEYKLDEWIPKEAFVNSIEISPAGLNAWQDGFACHRSQIDLLFPGEEEMRTSIKDYFNMGYGYKLWRF
jgi:hypothetical protein